MKDMPKKGKQFEKKCKLVIVLSYSIGLDCQSIQHMHSLLDPTERTSKLKSQSCRNCKIPCEHCTQWVGWSDHIYNWTGLSIQHMQSLLDPSVRFVSLIICNCMRSLIRYLQSLLDPQSSKPKKCTK